MKTAEEIALHVTAHYADNDFEEGGLDKVRSLIADAIEADRAQQVDTIAKLREVMQYYAGWHIDCPEDSWRFERDLWAALGEEIPEEEDGVNWAKERMKEAFSL